MPCLLIRPTRVSRPTWQHGADDRHRNADHDDQRIAQAFELRRQHQEDDDDREREGDQQLIAFVDVLPGVGQEIVAEAGG
jgi:hypothetical protein